VTGCLTFAQIVKGATVNFGAEMSAPDLIRIEPIGSADKSLQFFATSDGKASLDAQQNPHESWLDKARREACLLQEGVAGFKDAAEDAFSQHKVETIFC
jgi:hypothetical protein